MSGDQSVGVERRKIIRNALDTIQFMSFSSVNMIQIRIVAYVVVMCSNCSTIDSMEP